MSFERIKNAENQLDAGISPKYRDSIIHDRKPVTFSDTWNKPPTANSNPSQQTPQKSGFNGFKLFFIIAVLVFFSGLGLFIFSTLTNQSSISERNLTLSIDTKNSVDGGEEFPVSVTIINKNKVALELVTLKLDYSAPESIAPQFIEKKLDTLMAGETRVVDFSINLYGTANSKRTIIATLEYTPVESNITLTNEISYELLLRNSPVRMNVSLPEKTFLGGQVSFDVVINSDVITTVPDAVLQVQYPVGFRFARSNPTPDRSTNTWKLGNLTPGFSKTITITGTLTGVLQDQKLFTARIGTSATTDPLTIENIYSSTTVQTALYEPFLSVGIIPNATLLNSDYIITPGTNTDVRVVWKNTLGIPLEHAKITVHLSGNAFVPEQVKPGSGFYDKSAGTITWTESENQSLRLIGANSSGEMSFGFSTNIPDTLFIQAGKQYNLEAYASIDAIDQTGALLSVADTAHQFMRFSSQANLTASASYKNPSIKNIGSITPVVGKETTYAINWKISNTTNPLTKTKVTTTLPIWATFKSVIVPLSENNNLVYNNATREITWTVGDVARGVGYGTNNPRQVLFQIGVKPVDSQVGNPLTIINESVLTAVDSETETSITVNQKPITTKLLNENQAGNGSVTN